MAYPYTALPTSRQNDTSTGDPTQPTAEGFHAQSENNFARALNDLLSMLGTDPPGSWSTVQERFDQELLSLRATRSVGLIVHGATAGTARPTTHFAYIWRGTVVPTNLVVGRDIYMPTTSDTVGSGGGGGGSNAQDLVDLGALSGSVALNMSGRYNVLFEAQLVGNTTFSISNWPQAGAWCELRTVQPSPTPVSVTLPSCQWAERIPGAVTARASAIDRFGFQYAGGFNVDGFIIGNDFG